MLEIPEPIRGGSFIVVRFCYTGEDLEGRGEEFLKPWRETFGEPVFDTFGVMPCTMMDMISMDPVAPMGAYGHSEMLNDSRRKPSRRSWMWPGRTLTRP